MFKEINTSMFIQKIFHPVCLAFYFNDSLNIEYIVKNFGYPVLNMQQQSPLILALKYKHFNFAEQLFKALARYQPGISFSYKEMRCLLKHDLIFVKKLLN